MAPIVAPRLARWARGRGAAGDVEEEAAADEHPHDDGLESQAFAATSPTSWRPASGASHPPLGSYAEGFVTVVEENGVYVDIGVGSDAWVPLCKSLAEQFLVGDEVCGMTVVEHDLSNGITTLCLDNPLLENSLAKTKHMLHSCAERRNVRQKRQRGSRPMVSSRPPPSTAAWPPYSQPHSVALAPLEQQTSVQNVALHSLAGTKLSSSNRNGGSSILTPTQTKARTDPLPKPSHGGDSDAAVLLANKVIRHDIARSPDISGAAWKPSLVATKSNNLLQKTPTCEPKRQKHEQGLPSWQVEAKEGQIFEAKATEVLSTPVPAPTMATTTTGSKPNLQSHQHPQPEVKLSVTIPSDAHTVASEAQITTLMESMNAPMVNAKAASESDVADRALLFRDDHQVALDLYDSGEPCEFLAVCADCDTTRLVGVDFMSMGLRFDCSQLGFPCEGDAWTQKSKTSLPSSVAFQGAKVVGVEPLTTKEKCHVYSRYGATWAGNDTTRKKLGEGVQRIFDADVKQRVRYRDSAIATYKGEKVLVESKNPSPQEKQKLELQRIREAKSQQKSAV